MSKKRKTKAKRIPQKNIISAMIAEAKPKPEIATAFYFASDSNPNKPPYETLIYVDGSISCNCPGWTFKSKKLVTGERTCKHTRLVVSGLGEESAKKVVNFRPVRAFNPLAPGATPIDSIANKQAGVVSEPKQYGETKRRRIFNLGN